MKSDKGVEDEQRRAKRGDGVGETRLVIEVVDTQGRRRDDVEVERDESEFGAIVSVR